MSDEPDRNFITDRDLAILRTMGNIVCAAVSVPGAHHNVVALIGDVHAKLVSVLNGGPEQSAEGPVTLVPAVAVKKSITPDFIVCLEDGKQFKSLKRHLRTRYDLTPEQYRARWSLPADYPMVAPNYAAARSELAKNMGLGQQRRAPEPMQAAA